MGKNYNRSEYVNVDGQEIEVFYIDNDINGNARFVVHFLSLGIKLKDYGKIGGLVKYRAKWFGGGYVSQYVNINEELRWMLKQVNKYYNPYAQDLHRKGNLKAVAKMERLAKELTNGKDMGTAFLTNAYQGYDCIGLIANNQELTKYEGYVLFNELTNKAEFIQEQEK